VAGFSTFGLRGVDSLTEQLGLGETSYITTDALPALAPFENAILDRRVTFGLKVPNRNAI